MILRSWSIRYIVVCVSAATPIESTGSISEVLALIKNMRLSLLPTDDSIFISSDFVIARVFKKV